MRVVTLLAALAFFGAAAYAGSGQRNQTDGVCALVWKPVCAQDGSAIRTFPNQCVAERERYTVIGKGECEAAGAGASVHSTAPGVSSAR